ncbi:MAG: YhcH/YjgK/YiaL family protein [Oligoflexia bacterium]|nr:YhcH/YjgK/YiaL family protein [Oligoflexia bacterium]MBF0365012.1 YhcH/YjgK/YiaL family protein [Oligoflexia bacterium]
MIWDEIKNLAHYHQLCPELCSVEQFLSQEQGMKFPGRYEITASAAGSGIFALTQEYRPKVVDVDAENPLCFIESHRRYVDVQLVVEGAECVGFAPTSLLLPDVSNSYEEEKDLDKWKGFAHLSFLPLRKGAFMIFFPWDAHMPSLNRDATVTAAATVKKVVVKIPLQLFVPARVLK